MHKLYIIDNTYMQVVQKYKLVMKRHLKNIKIKKTVIIKVIAMSLAAACVLTGLGISINHLASRLSAKSNDMAGTYSGKLARDTDNAVDNFKTSIQTSQAAAAAAKIAADKAATKAKSSNKSGGLGSVDSGSSSHFKTLPLGSALPSDATCSSEVRSASETRSANKTANSTKGSGGNTEFTRVTGNFTGTTDEILQWVACKWGIDEDIVRAQAAMESWWFHRTLGDYTTDPALCAPTHPISGGQCPESVGILQVRYTDHKSAFVNNSAINSTAYNADYAYAVWRDCYGGGLADWINDEEKGAVYAAGDVWGCIGEWFSGRWYTPDSNTYINSVKNYLNTRVWEDEDFLTAT